MDEITVVPTPDTTPPAAPTGLMATASNGEVSLGWADNADSDLAGYNVRRATTSGGPYSTIAFELATSDYIDNAVVNGTTYYYVVSAVDASGNVSAGSSQASATPNPVGPEFQESGGLLSMEAENGILGSRWQTGANAAASDGAYLVVDPLYNWTGSSPECTSADCIGTYEFKISTSGNYRFWFRIFAANADDDSFFWRIDDGGWNLENNRNGNGAWFSTDNSQVNSLSAGSHILEVVYRENGTGLDKFVIQLDSLTTPSGLGPSESARSSSPPAPGNLSAALDGQQLQLTWPADQGWRLQALTNSLSGGANPDWTTITDGSISGTNIAVDPGNEAVFYRLVYP